MKTEEIIKKTQKNDLNTFFKPPALAVEDENEQGDVKEEELEDTSKWNQIEESATIEDPYVVIVSVNVPCFTGPGRQHKLIRRLLVGEKITIVATETTGKISWGKNLANEWLPLNFTKRGS